MGRYPLRTRIEAYMGANKEYLAEETLTERQRKLLAFAKRYEKICKTNPDFKGDPAKWGEKEIIAIILDTKGRGWSLETQAKELGNVQALLRFVGNGTLDKMRASKPYMFPRRSPTRGPSLNGEELSRVFKAAQEVGGWMGEVALMVMATLAYTGLRPGELRKAEVKDLDLTTWTLRVAHPKGESSYGKYRVAPIPDPLRPIVLRYLRARDRMLAEKGVVDAKPLICSMRRPGEFYSSKHMRHLKKTASERSGVAFELRTLRRTYGQTLLDRKVPLETVSLALGHASTRTTETYYCRKDADSARLEILKAFEGPATGPSAENPLIERETDFTGYV